MQEEKDRGSLVSSGDKITDYINPEPLTAMFPEPEKKLNGKRTYAQMNKTANPVPEQSKTNLPDSLFPPSESSEAPAKAVPASP